MVIHAAKTGVNFPPMHINCRCHIGIVDEFGNLLFEIDGEKHDTDVMRTEKDNAEFDPRWLSYIPFFGYGYTLGEGIYALINEEMRNKFDSEDWQQRMMLSTFIFATIGEALVNAGFTGNESMSEIGNYIQHYMGNAWDYITGKFKGVGKANPNNVKVSQGQQDKHIPGTNNYKQSVNNGVNRSILTENPQNLLDDFAGTGTIVGQNREWVDFGKNIGQFYDINTGTYVDTTKGIIHYNSSGGAHIVPSNPTGTR